MTINTLYPIYSNGRAISHICLSLCEHMRGEGMDVRLLVPASEPAGRRPFARDAIPPWLRRLAYRLDGDTGRIQRLTERRYLAGLAPGDVAYLWPGVSRATYEAVKRRGHTLVMERINCHRATSRRILEDAYARLGWPAEHGISEADVELERQKLGLADFVFAPSPPVARSLLEAGVPGRKILPASYGWDPERLAGDDRALPPCDGLTVLFVGYICVRKGAHLLLEAWARAGIRGRLVLVGQVAPDIARGCAAQLARPDVVHVPYTACVAPYYRAADVFAFPTLEEGSPLVSYEALASRLPVLISPMGAGQIVRDECEGLVREPYDQPAWIAAFERLARDAELRRQMADAAARRAAQFTWRCAGLHRRKQLMDALQPVPAAAEFAG